jgi:hypothetical protein
MTSIPTTTTAHIEKLFPIFLTKLNESPYELPEAIYPYLKEALAKSGFGTAPTSTVASASATTAVASGVAKKKLSGYNIFMKEMMAELKTQGVPAVARMTQVGELWKTVNKDDWKAKANIYNAGTPSGVVSTTKATASTGGKKLSGYQYYVKVTMAKVKENKEIASTGRMTEIGRLWKLQTEPQKASWKAKAEAFLAGATLPEEAEVEEVKTEADEEELDPDMMAELTAE